MEDAQLNDDWMEYLGGQFQMDYMVELKKFLKQEKKKKKIIYPKGEEVFNAFNLTPLDEVKVVIIGQDPYHGESQAHGLCFSVLPGIKVPPSLRNIYKELESDIGMVRPEHGFLESWAEQGVLMINTVLTVEKGKPGAHQGKGWESFTDVAVEVLNKEKENIVFLLWGSHAHKKGASIDREKHLVLESTHPSPFSAYRGFLGSGHFSKTNKFLKEIGKSPIDWDLPVLE